MENSQRVRSINNVIQGVDLTPEDPDYATFEQYRYFSGVRYDDPSLNKIPRELLDPEIPSPLPKPPSKAPIIVEGVDQTPDDPDWATYYEYHFSDDGIREKLPRQVKQLRNRIELQNSPTATPATAPVNPPGIVTRKVVQKIGLNPDHPQYSTLKDQSALQIIKSTLYSEPDELPKTPPTKAHHKSPTTAIRITKSPSTSSQQSPSPTSLSTTKKHKMARPKKQTLFKPGACGRCSIVLKPACRVHKALVDSKEYVVELIELVDLNFDELTGLHSAWNEYENKTAKELCGTCTAMHSKKLTKAWLQREHGALIELFFVAVAEIKTRIKLYLPSVIADRDNYTSIVEAASTLGCDRGEDEKGEFTQMAADLANLFEKEISDLEWWIEEYSKDRPFTFLDEYRLQAYVEADARAAEIEQQKIQLAASTAEIELRQKELAKMDEEREAVQKRHEAYHKGLIARSRCADRKLDKVLEQSRMGKWKEESVRVKLRGLIEDGMEEGKVVEMLGGVSLEDAPLDVLMAVAQGECGTTDLFGGMGKKFLLKQMGWKVMGEFDFVDLEDVGAEGLVAEPEEMVQEPEEMVQEPEEMEGEGGVDAVSKKGRDGDDHVSDSGK